jgi:predicted ester cyclase
MAQPLRAADARRRARLTQTSGGIIRGLGVSEENKAAARVAFEVWNTGDLDRLDQYIAPNVVHHDPYDPDGANGLAGMKRTIKRNRERTPDLRITIEDQIAEGNKVATRWTAMMTQQGKKVSLKGISIDRFENGKIVEAWRNIDMLGLLQQTGTAPK